MKLMNWLAATVLANVLWGATAAGAADFQLIGEEQMQREQQYQATLPARNRRTPMVTRSQHFPAIRVLAPEVDTSKLPGHPAEGAAAAAAGLRVSTDARILPQTFRALYGMLKLKYTETLRKHAQLTEKGMLAEGAGMPRPARTGCSSRWPTTAAAFTEREVRFPRRQLTPRRASATAGSSSVSVPAPGSSRARTRSVICCAMCPNDQP